MGRDIFFQTFLDAEVAVSQDFATMKERALAVARTLFSPAAETTIEDAFDAVGICASGSSAPPSMSLTSLGDLLCAGHFVPTWPSIPRATRYYGEIGSQVLGFAFATPVTDVNSGTTHCNFQVSGPAVFHIRACNDCGCGPWSQTYQLPYWSPCP